MSEQALHPRLTDEQMDTFRQWIAGDEHVPEPIISVCVQTMLQELPMPSGFPIPQGERIIAFYDWWQRWSGVIREAQGWFAGKKGEAS